MEEQINIPFFCHNKIYNGITTENEILARTQKRIIKCAVFVQKLFANIHGKTYK